MKINFSKKSIFFKRGRFIHPILFAFAKTTKKTFLTNKNFTLNLRSSSFLKIFFFRTLNVHNGRKFFANDPVFMKPSLLAYSKYNFKIGQFALTRPIHEKRRIVPGRQHVLDDLKRKEGAVFKPKKKKNIFFLNGPRSKS